MITHENSREPESHRNRWIQNFFTVNEKYALVEKLLELVYH